MGRVPRTSFPRGDPSDGQIRPAKIGEQIGDDLETTIINLFKIMVLSGVGIDPP